MKRIVIKIGSNILAGTGAGIDGSVINAICRDISCVADQGNEIVIVSSGAVAAGMGKLGLKTKPKEIRFKQAAAAIGQSSLMWSYEKAFTRHDRKVAQVLLTLEDISNRKRYINAKNTFFTLLSYGVIPIVNENDTVATDEIQFGDNDQLASYVAILIEAEKLIILSDVDGLYESDPRHDSHARIIGTVEAITPEIERRAGASLSAVGTGGMCSKVMAAKRAVSHGIGVHIINGKKSELIGEVLSGKTHGTYFVPAECTFSRKKGWIAFSSRVKGVVTVDDGAKDALVNKGKSLLPSGINAIDGHFERGDSVYCVDAGGTRVAKGLSNYSSEELRKIMGHRTSDIERLLGYKYSDEAIHRDNLVVL